MRCTTGQYTGLQYSFFRMTQVLQSGARLQSVWLNWQRHTAPPPLAPLPCPLLVPPTSHLETETPPPRHLIGHRAAWYHQVVMTATTTITTVAAVAAVLKTRYPPYREAGLQCADISSPVGQVFRTLIFSISWLWPLSCLFRLSLISSCSTPKPPSFYPQSCCDSGRAGPLWAVTASSVTFVPALIPRCDWLKLSDIMVHLQLIHIQV